MKTPSSKILVALAVLGLAAMSGTSNAQTILIDPTTLNGSFEAPTVTKIASGFDSSPDITNWGNTGTAFNGAAGVYTDTGVQNDPAQSAQGSQFAFFKPTEGGTFDLTTYVIKSGDQFTLSWDAGATGAGGNQLVNIFSSTDGTYATNFTLSTTLGNAADNLTTFTNPPTYLAYSLTYTATGADVGKTIGISVFNSGTAYIAEDNFSLVVTSAVPEPSTYLYLSIAGVVFFFMYRARQRKIVA